MAEQKEIEQKEIEQKEINELQEKIKQGEEAIANRNAEIAQAKKKLEELLHKGIKNEEVSGKAEDLKKAEPIGKVAPVTPAGETPTEDAVAAKKKADEEAGSQKAAASEAQNKEAWANTTAMVGGSLLLVGVMVAGVAAPVALGLILAAGAGLLAKGLYDKYSSPTPEPTNDSKKSEEEKKAEGEKQDSSLASQLQAGLSSSLTPKLGAGAIVIAAGIALLFPAAAVLWAPILAVGVLAVAGFVGKKLYDKFATPEENKQGPTPSQENANESSMDNKMAPSVGLGSWFANQFNAAKAMVMEMFVGKKVEEIELEDVSKDNEEESIEEQQANATNESSNLISMALAAGGWAMDKITNMFSAVTAATEVLYSGKAETAEQEIAQEPGKGNNVANGVKITLGGNTLEEVDEGEKKEKDKGVDASSLAGQIDEENKDPNPTPPTDPNSAQKPGDNANPGLTPFSTTFTPGTGNSNE